MLFGSPPDWLVAAAGATSHLQRLPYVIADPPIAGAFIIGYPQRAGTPTLPSNKLVWAVRTGNGAPLEIVAHPLDSPIPSIRHISQANGTDGYSDGVDVPTPGCWQLTLQWATSQASVELEFFEE
jgi:hypothetical protein